MTYGFHPDALLEYAEATNYYLQEASTDAAGRFIAAVESAVASILDEPTRWRVVEEPSIRRYVFSLTVSNAPDRAGSRIPKGFRPPAQGCDAPLFCVATLGNAGVIRLNLEEVAPACHLN